MIVLQNERKKIIYVLYDDLKRSQIIYVSYNSLEI